jgi:outer membrane protein
MQSKISKKLLGAALCAFAALPAFAQQQADGPWLVRARAVHLSSANGDSTGLGLSINDKWIPEVDVSYFFAPAISAELILTVPQKQTLNSSALRANIGTLRHLPPTLTAQYHFNGLGPVVPYVGAGVNFTQFSSVHLPAGVTIDKTSWGGALQVGFDVPVAKNVVVNFDVKKVWIQTDVKAAGTKIGTFKVDPLLVGVGVGYRF